MEIMREVIEETERRGQRMHLQATEKDKEMGSDQSVGRGKKGILG